MFFLLQENTFYSYESPLGWLSVRAAITAAAVLPGHAGAGEGGEGGENPDKVCHSATVISQQKISKIPQMVSGKICI